jgi:hypothetical protein
MGISVGEFVGYQGLDRLGPHPDQQGRAEVESLGPCPGAGEGEVASRVEGRLVERGQEADERDARHAGRPQRAPAGLQLGLGGVGLGEAVATRPVVENLTQAGVADAGRRGADAAGAIVVVAARDVRRDASHAHGQGPGAAAVRLGVAEGQPLPCSSDWM